MTQTPIIVPIHLDALVVNQNVAARDGALRWWRYNYQALNSFDSPEPEAFDRQIGDTLEPGVYLHWTLPRALRSGVRSNADGPVDYPLVPNRWLIVRMHGDQTRQATAWVIESDCPLTPAVKRFCPYADVAQMSMYLVDPEIVKTWQNSYDELRNTIDLKPHSSGPLIANIGMRFPPSTMWTERAASDKGFLTAVAAGNPAFSIYYPHNVGVFSMFDDLAGIDTDMLSYMAVGWYANPDDDVMAGWKNAADPAQAYQTLLSEFNWSLTNDPSTGATQSIYQGLALSLQWDRDGPPPANDPLDNIRNSGKLNVAVGNTAIDAFSSMIGTHLQQAGHPTTTLNLLKAFQYNLLPVLNQVNGDAILEQSICQAWFGSEAGGHWWTIVDKGADGDGTTTALTVEEATWLAQLNADQAQLEETLRALFALQWDFNAAWWKLGKDPDSTFPPLKGGPTTAELQAYLNPENASGITGRLLAVLQTAQGLLTKVPRPAAGGKTDQDAWQAGIGEYAKQKGLAATKTLKAVPGPRFWQANNPVVILSGVKPPPGADPDEVLKIRPPCDLVSELVVGDKRVGKDTLGSAMPTVVQADGLSQPLHQTFLQLMTEFVLLDPASAPLIAKACGRPVDDVATAITARDAVSYRHPLPQFGSDPWSQPWEPMYVEWKLTYAHIPDQSGDNRNWSFDGVDYVFAPRGSTPDSETREVGGISLLSPHTQNVFHKRLKQFLSQHPNADLSQLETWIVQIDDWAFLTQELTGMNDLLALRDPRAFRRPSPQEKIGSGSCQASVADLAGFPSDNTPSTTGAPGTFAGHVGTTPYLSNGPAIPFHGVRQGQFYFNELSVYDKFGRLLRVIEKGTSSGLHDARNFPLAIDTALAADTSVFPRVKSVFQTPPRPLQPSRLNVTLIDGLDADKTLGVTPAVNPIAGWVLPNHLGHGLGLYDPTGAALGEFRMFAQPDGSLKGQWEAPPHGDVTSLQDVRTRAPHLYKMITAPELEDQANFETFMKVIDSALWTVDPLGGRSDQNLSVLIGRPLALVRARLSLRTHGPAFRDTSRLTAAPPAFLNQEFSVRLGDQATREDGVIGYFTGGSYGQFNAVANPQATVSQSYVHQIGPLGDTGVGNFIKLRFAESSSQLVTILTDPRATMHAATGILPVKKVQLPEKFIYSALSRIEIGFRTGPVLTHVGLTPTQGEGVPRFPTSVEIPSPREQGGVWSWWEKATDADGTGYGVVTPSVEAKLKDANLSLREGTLQLKIDLRKGNGDTK